MLDRNSDYALNKFREGTIVYRSVTGAIHELTPCMFASEAEFRKWKEWSDLDYYNAEKNWCKHSRRMISLHLLTKRRNATPSVEEEFFAQMMEAERNYKRADMIWKIRKKLTEKQFRRLWVYFVENQTETQIATIEGVSQQRISAGIIASIKKIKVFSKKSL